jgi:hypothetical protein
MVSLDIDSIVHKHNMKNKVYFILIVGVLVYLGGCRRSSGNRQDEGFLQVNF